MGGPFFVSLGWFLRLLGLVDARKQRVKINEDEFLGKGLEE